MRHVPTRHPRAGVMFALVVLLLVPVSVGVGVPGVPGVPGPVPAEASTPVTPMVSSSGDHTCELVADGTVRCWGRNESGQLGDGTTTDRPHRVTVRLSAADGGGPLTGVSAISVGGSHTCALLDDGTIRCWGENQRGQLGVATTGTGSDPRRHPETALTFGSPTATAVVAGGQHTCALLSDGTVRCWGANGTGQLGNGAVPSPSSAPNPTPTPVFVSGTSGAELSGVTQIAAGFAHTCAVVADGTVRCWGRNTGRQLGHGTATATVKNPAVVVGIDGTGSLTDITEITAGFQHTCALTSSENVRCWGENDAGQVGDGTTSQATSPTPVRVSGTSGTELSGVTAIAAGTGSGHTCALTTGGAAQCWGANTGGGIATGQLGDGTSTNRSNPVAVLVSGTSGAALTGVTSIAPAGQHTCALLDTGAARCWGRNDFGQVGLGRVFDSSSSGVLNPVVVRSATDPAGVLAVPAPSCSAKFSTTSTMDAPFAQLTEAADFWVELTFDRDAVIAWAGALTTSASVEGLWGVVPTLDANRVDLRLDVRAAGASPATGTTVTSAEVTPAVAFGAAELGTFSRTLLGPDAGTFRDLIARMPLRGRTLLGAVTSFPGSSTLLDGTPSSPIVVPIDLGEISSAVTGWGLAPISSAAPLRPEVVLSLHIAVGERTLDEQMAVVLPCGGPATLPVVDPPVHTPAASGPAVSCAPDVLAVGTEVACTVTGGAPGIDILWRAAVNPVIASDGVTLDADGRGTFGFTVPPSALGGVVTVELVEWTRPVAIGGGAVVGGPVPSSVPAGEGGTGPVGLLALIALLGAVGAVGAVGASRGRRPGFCPVEKSSQNP